MKTLMMVITAGIFFGLQSSNQSDAPQKLVSPSEYRTIPKEVRDSLEQQHCQLPEGPTYEGKTKINAVSGHSQKRSKLTGLLCVW